MSRAARKEERARLEAEYFAARLVSCPDCGVLCRKSGWDATVMNLHAAFIPTDYLPDWFHQATLTQGIGVTQGCEHRCPPTFADLIPESTNEHHSKRPSP